MFHGNEDDLSTVSTVSEVNSENALEETETTDISWQDRGGAEAQGAAAKQWKEADERRLTGFLPTVAAAKLAAAKDGCLSNAHESLNASSLDAAHALPTNVLAALLEDPVHILTSGKPYPHNVYEEVPIVWQRIRDISSTDAVLQGAVHETTQVFVRPLSFGRQRCFRLHRFLLRSEPGIGFFLKLSQLALQRAATAVDEASLQGLAAAQLRGSNVGGFQDLLASDHALAAELRSSFTGAVREAATQDAAKVVVEEESSTPPCSPRCDTFAAWMNVSQQGALNYLHNHGTSSWAAVAYTKIPHHERSQRNEGALLLRLSRGHGSSFIEPDEDLHVPHMWLPPRTSEAFGRKESELSEPNSLHTHTEPTPSEAGEAPRVRYVQVEPLQNSLLIFPGWLPHSVAPHFCQESRVCYASNWT